MKDIRNIAAWFLAISLLCLFSPAASVWATPVEVILFPDYAQVTEISQIPVRQDGKGRGTAILLLRGQVRMESLKVFPEEDPDLKISNVSWRILTNRGLAQREAQQKQLRSLTEERKRLSAVIKGLETEITFWQSQTKAKTKTLKDAMNLSAAISRNTKKAWQEKMTLEGECEKLDLRIKALSEEVKRMQEADDGEREATLSLSGLKPEKRMLSLKYSYALSNCGWTSLYRVEGKPAQERVEFSWDAEVWQNSMQDWTNVQLSLAIHGEAPTVAVPETLPVWKIDASKQGKRRSAAKGATAETAVVPVRNPMAPFQRTLGRRSLPAGRKQSILVENAGWSASFSRVLRPFSQRNAHIRAVVSSPLPMQIPENPALLLLDGILVGRQEFGFSGQKKTLFFGSDPTLSAEVKMLSEPGDAQAFDGEKQVWDWRWQTIVKNEGDRAVRVRIEEPLPKIRDRRLKSEVRGEPDFTPEDATSGVRDLELPPGGSRTMETFVHIEAPRDISVEMSWTP